MVVADSANRLGRHLFPRRFGRDRRVPRAAGADPHSAGAPVKVNEMRSAASVGGHEGRCTACHPNTSSSSATAQPLQPWDYRLEAIRL